MNIEIKDLSFSYGQRMIFEHLSADVPSQKFTCLIGPNGAGKTTLLKSINGILKPKSGQILVDGQDVQTIPLRERAKIFGYVPQFTSAQAGLNAMEMVLSGRVPHMQGKASPSDVAMAEQLLQQLHLEAFAMRPLNQLSGGERQRILMARALAQEPKIMILDEPSSNLDMHYQLETMELLRSTCHDQGIGVIAVIHDLNAVLRYGDYALLFAQDGVQAQSCLLAQGTPESVITAGNMQRAFQVDVGFAQVGDITVMTPLRSLVLENSQQN